MNPEPNDHLKEQQHSRVVPCLENGYFWVYSIRMEKGNEVLELLVPKTPVEKSMKKHRGYVQAALSGQQLTDQAMQATAC
jgi:hypothetical protein